MRNTELSDFIRKHEELREKARQMRRKVARFRDQFARWSKTVRQERLKERENSVLYWGPLYIKCVAAEYLRFLTDNPLRPGVKGSRASSSHYHRFLSLMAEEIGKTMEDTTLLCDRVISAGDEAFEMGSCPGLCVFVEAAQAHHDKGTLLMNVHECRSQLEKYSSLAAELPDQVALFSQAKILDELL